MVGVPEHRVTIDSARCYSLVTAADQETCCHAIADPVVHFACAQPYVEVVPVQPGMHLHLTKVPANTRLAVAFDIQNAPFTFECWLQGGMDYCYTRGDEICGRDQGMAGRLLIGSAGKEQGFAETIGGDAIDVVQLMIDPALLRLTLEKSLCGCRLHYRDYIYPNGTQHRFASIPIPSSILPLAQSISSCPEKEPFRRLILANKAHELFYALILELFLGPCARNGATLPPRDIARFYRVKELIEQNLHPPLSHSQIAKEVGINEFKLKTGFKELFGQTVYGYLLEKRMAKAKDLLENGTSSVSEVAWDIGYTNVSHFISVFRKFHGVTPGKFLASVRRRLASPASRAIS